MIVFKPYWLQKLILSVSGMHFWGFIYKKYILCKTYHAIFVTINLRKSNVNYISEITDNASVCLMSRFLLTEDLIEGIIPDNESEYEELSSDL